MSEPKPRLVQVLCGPARHAIIAIPYSPGLTAAQRDFGSTDDITLTEGNAVEYVRGLIAGLVERQSIDPWCGLCGAKLDCWLFEDAPLKFNTLEEALPHLRRLETEQAMTRRFFTDSKN